MNQKLRKSKAVTYVIVAVSLLIFLLIWPLGLIHKTTILKSDETVARESGAVSVENNLTQMFVAQEGELRAVDLYVCNEMQGETITFRLYDASYKELFNTFYVVGSEQKLPGFVHIPVGYSLTKDQEYYYTIEGLSADLFVNLEDTYDSTSIVNGILAYGGEELPGYNIIIRYEYTNAFSWYFVLIYGVILAVVATLLVYLTQILFGKVWEDKEITLQRVLQITCNPIITILTIMLLYLVFPGRKFGTGYLNYAFYGTGILLLAFYLLYAINARRKLEANDETSDWKSKIPSFLQSLCFAGVLWSCYEYWNGLYDIHHAYATCKVLCYFFLSIIVTYKKKELLNIANLIYLITSVVFSYFYTKPYVGVVEKGELYQLQSYVIIIGGFVIINSIYILIKMIRTKDFKKPRLLYFILIVILLAGMIIFRNTRTWPIVTAVMVLLFILRMCIWEGRNELSKNLCNGIYINFIIAVIFCLLHRPYHAFIYYRYGMMFHTVTVTAEYLTLVVGAAFVMFFKKYFEINRSGEKNVIVAMWKEIIFLGTSSVYMLLTLSRTGFFAIAAMLLILFIIYILICVKEKERLGQLGKMLLLTFLTCVISFPVVFTFTRLLPALNNDPIHSEVEETDWTIQKGEPSNSEKYMDIERFLYVTGIKIFNISEESKDNSCYSYPLNHQYVTNSDNIDAKDNVDEVVESNENPDEQTVNQVDFSNGRIELFEEYRKEWNLTGHDEMGVMMKNGDISVHAHNSFLQAIHDFGLIVGIYIMVFGALTFVYAVNIFRKCYTTNMYRMITISIVVGFCAAGMAEWMFHICNPMGFALFMCMIPILFTENENKDQINE